jgi:precorrin-3B C17-methyltransferase
MTYDAVEAIKNSQVVVGYTGYIKYIEDINPSAEIIQNGMRGETERCRMAVERALEGKRVCVVSSGDAGVYGMASLIHELSAGHPELSIEVVPGVTAALAAAALLGAPISGDFAAVSLSDLLTGWELIEKRLKGAAQGDFVICVYNPSSRSRADHLQRACEILLEYKPAHTICGVVRNAYRPEQSVYSCTLPELKSAETDMFTTVIVGNANTEMINGKMVTARGYNS